MELIFHGYCIIATQGTLFTLVALIQKKGYLTVDQLWRTGYVNSP